MTCPPHPWLDYSNYVWRGVQVMKLLSMQSSPITCLNDVKWKFLTLAGLELPPLGRSARSQSLYRLSYPTIQQTNIKKSIQRPITINLFQDRSNDLQISSFTPLSEPDYIASNDRIKNKLENIWKKTILTQSWCYPCRCLKGHANEKAPQSGLCPSWESNRTSIE
jgi:hypothetical protein